MGGTNEVGSQLSVDLSDLRASLAEGDRRAFALDRRVAAARERIAKTEAQAVELDRVVARVAAKARSVSKDLLKSASADIVSEGLSRAGDPTSPVADLTSRAGSSAFAGAVFSIGQGMKAAGGAAVIAAVIAAIQWLMSLQKEHEQKMKELEKFFRDELKRDQERVEDLKLKIRAEARELEDRIRDEQFEKFASLQEAIYQTSQYVD